MSGGRLGLEEVAQTGIKIAERVSVGIWGLSLGLGLGLGFIGTPEPAHGASRELGD